MSKRELEKLYDTAETAIEEFRDALREAFDDRSERWQNSEAGEEWQERIDAADRALNELSQAHPRIDA